MGNDHQHSLKVVTYNIHSCIDMYRNLNMEKIACVIADLDPDVVALQEVDVNKLRTNMINQAKWLADRLGMQYLFYPVVKNGSEKYGLAILAGIPMEKMRFGVLPAILAKKPRELRGVMWVRLKTRQGPVNLINTHLGLLSAERRLQVRTLLGGKWLGGLADLEPVVFCGDFNAGRRSYVYRQICKRFRDVQVHKKERGSIKATFFSLYPLFCIDHIFVSSHFSTLRVRVPATQTARTASDHLPVFAKIVIG
ncbi:MAG: endonuclease/exonuclease/phosphatase family protein [Desulfobacterales bacterium]